jgi:hypothetical protein
MRGITEDEIALLNHISRWGSDGYPVMRRGRKWWVDDWRGVRGVPSPFTTKRAAVAHFERFLDILLDAKAGRL